MTPEPGTTTAHARDDRSRPSGVPWWAIAAVAVGVCLVVNIVVAWSARHPSFPFDEVSTFQMSRMLAGEATPPVRGAGYFPGWAFLLAPIWWLTDDPTTFYRVGAGLGVVVAMATVWPLALLGRRWGLTTPQAIAAAAVTMTMPVRTIQGDYLLSERLLVLFVVLAVLAAHRFAEKPSWSRAPEVGVWLGLGLFTHARLLPILLAAGVWFLLVLAGRRWAALGGLAVLALAGWLAQRGGQVLNERLLGRPFSQEEALDQVLAQLTPGLLARTGLGQSWYQVLATFGLVSIAVIVVGTMVWRELVVGRRAGGGTFVLGVASAAFLSSALRWADAGWLVDSSWVRLDVWVYGRYNDSIFVVLFMLAVAAVLGSLTLRVWWGSIALTAGLSVPVVLWLATWAPTWGFVTPAHIPGVLPWWFLLPTEPWSRADRVPSTPLNDNGFWIWASVTVLAVLLVLMALRGRGRTTIAVLGVLAVAGTLVSDVRSDRFQEAERLDSGVVTALEQLEETAGPVDIVYDLGCSRGGSLTAVGQNYLGFALLPSELGAADRSSGPVPEQVVLGCVDWDRADSLGAVPLAGDTAWGSEAFVLPGPVQDVARREGLLAQD